MRRISLIPTLLILLSSGISIVTGVLLDLRSPAGTSNYRAIYYGARSVFQHRDPYRPADFQQVYDQESGEYPSDPVQNQLFRRAVLTCVNLPSTLFLIAPLAKLPWGVSHVIWLILIGTCFTVAGFLAFDLGSDYAPRLSLLLVCLLLANSEVLFAVGNTAGIAVSLCVISIWCFIRLRGSWIGVLCLSASLLLKPHDSGLLWAYLIIFGGVMRKRALWTLIVCLVVAVTSVLWISRVAPHWNTEMKGNLASTAQRGDISDPGPSSISRRGSADVIISLQTVFSLVQDDPAFYNPSSILVCACLFAAILFTSVRNQAQIPSAWYAIAAISALTMLPSYHRPYDARLLLLAVPACAMLWAEGGRMQRAQCVSTVGAVLLTGDIPLAILSLITRNLNVSSMNSLTRIFELPILRPAPLILLLLVILYLVSYARRTQGISISIRNPERCHGESMRQPPETNHGRSNGTEMD